MMIVDLALQTVEVPVPGLLTTYGTHAVQRRVVVRLTTDGGEIGYGEASPLPFFTGETVDTVRAAIASDLGPAVIGLDPFDIDVAHHRMDRVLPRNPSAKAALDMALYDLMGQIAHVPVCKLLGGAYRSTIDLAEAIGILDPEETVAQARRLVELGFRTLKLKIGVEPARDVTAVRAVRRAVGDTVRIRVDANQGYTNQTAIDVLRQITDCDLEYVEQPVPAWDLEGLARIRRSVAVRVLVDESVHSPRDALELIRREACDLFGIKLIKTAGLYPARQIAAIGEQAGIECVVISPWESEIGLAAGAHLAASLASARPAQELTPVEGTALLAGFDVRENHGRLRVPSDPGLGVRPVGEGVFTSSQ